MASIFTKILKGEIPGKIIFQDDLCAAIADIQPQAPHHILVFPKQELRSMAEATERDEKLLGHLLHVAAEIARTARFSADGYRITINTGKHGGQTIDHLHVHLLGGRPMHWPPG